MPVNLISLWAVLAVSGLHKYRSISFEYLVQPSLAEKAIAGATGDVFTVLQSLLLSQGDRSIL